MERIKRNVPSGGPLMPDRTNSHGEELGSARNSASTDDGGKPDGVGNKTSCEKLSGRMKIAT